MKSAVTLLFTPGYRHMELFTSRTYFLPSLLIHDLIHHNESHIADCSYKMDATKKALPVHLRKSFNPEAASFSPVERTGPAVQVTTTATSSLQSILGFAPEDVNQKQSSNLTCLDQKQAPINESMISEVHQLKDDQGMHRPWLLWKG